MHINHEILAGGQLMMAIKIKAAQKCLQILWIRPGFSPRQFQASDSCTLLNSGTNLSLRKTWTIYFILQEWSRRTEQSLRLTDWQHPLHTSLITENFSGLSQAQRLEWAMLFTALHCVVGRKWGSETLLHNLPYFLKTLTNDQAMVQWLHPQLTLLSGGPFDSCFSGAL